jgi:hypothetical protein
MKGYISEGRESVGISEGWVDAATLTDGSPGLRTAGYVDVQVWGGGVRRLAVRSTFPEADTVKILRANFRRALIDMDVSEEVAT